MKNNQAWYFHKHVCRTGHPNMLSGPALKQCQNILSYMSKITSYFSKKDI